ncbi:MAG: DUF4190 domain-containing protein [Planctomycetaceae bacterium]|jgi:hypothetical protein|nr:DUF4190 domain-containing protein [Planctomycetaceae bacterium]
MSVAITVPFEPRYTSPMQQEFDQSISTITKEELSGKGVTAGYRAVSVLAVVALFLSLFTPLMLMSNWFIIFPLSGAACGLFGLYKILTCPFDYTGKGFAMGGIVFSFVLGLTSAGWGIYQFYFNVPYGYTAVDFLELRPDPQTNKLPETILQIAKDHRKIYIKGYIYPGRQMSGIQNFMFVRTVEHCQFCSPEQNPFDMISVHCIGDLRIQYRPKQVHIGGELYINETFKYGELPYHIEADLFR